MKPRLAIALVLMVLLSALPTSAARSPDLLPVTAPMPTTLREGAGEGTPLESSLQAFRNWRLERVDAPRTFEWMGSHSLALDPAGNPHIAYGADRLYYAWHDGATWHIETVDASWRVGRFTSLVLDPAGRAAAHQLL